MKKPIRLVLIAVILSMPFASFAQDFVLKGVIFEKGTNIRLALSEITNLRTKLGTGSNDLGIFNIKVSLGDTLLITKRSFADQRIIINNSKDLVVYLSRQVNQLEDVTVRSQSKKDDLAEIKREYKNKGVYNGGKSSFLSAIFSPLNALYNLIGSEPRNARRFNRYAENELKQSEIDRYFNATIIKSNTALEGEKLERYMLDCRPTYEKAQYWNSYDYIKYIKDSAKNFTDTLGKGK